MKIFTTVISSFLFFFSHVFAQQFVIKQAKEGLDDKYHTAALVKTQKGNYVSIAWDIESKVSLQLFDSSLNLLPGKVEDRVTKYELTQPFYIGGKVALLAYGYKKMALYYTDEQLVNPLTMQELFKPSGGTPKISCGYSTDSSYYYIVTRSEEGRNSPVLFEGVVLNKKLNIVSHINMASTDGRKDFTGASYFLNTHGQFYVFCSSANRNELLMQEASGNSKTIAIDGLSKGIADHCSLVEKNNKVYFCSILPGKSDKALTGIQSGIIDLNSNSVKLTTDASASRSVIPGTYKIEEQSPVAQFAYPDGSYIFVFEQDELINHQSHYGGTNKPSYSYNGFMKRDVYVVKFSREWSVEWFRRITKAQNELDMHNYIGITCMPDRQGGLHIIMNDDRSNTNVEAEKTNTFSYNTIGKSTLTSINITKDGRTSKQFISDNKSDDFSFSPFRATCISPNEIFYMGTDAITLTRRCRFKPQIIMLLD